MLEAAHLVSGYQGRPLLQDISLALQPGQLTVLIGPNGSGKSTLLKALARLLPPFSGTVTLDGTPLASYTPKVLARRLAVLPQLRQTPSLSVATLVAHGRYPHHGYFSRLNDNDRKVIATSLERCGIAHLHDRNLPSLSGGERQRAYLAMALAQDTELILLDEPTTFLDIAHQLEVLNLLQELSHQGKTILAVLHDLQLALRYADMILLLADGRLLGKYTSDELLDSGMLERVFQIAVHRFEQNGESFTAFTSIKSIEK